MIEFAQIERARNKARRGLVHTHGDTFQITMWDDDKRIESARMYLHRIMSDTAAGHRRSTFIGDQAQVDSYIQAVIGALT